MSTSPSRLGQYELLQPIGRGHVGEVWKAHDVAQKKDVAVKILHSDLQADPYFLNRFANGGRMLTSLRQDNLVSVYDAIVTRPEQARETTAYIVMDYIDGYTLTNYLQATSHRGLFPPIAEINYLFSKLAAVVDYLHQKGVVHGDIKPENILLDKQHRHQFNAGEPLLTDVGTTLMAGNDSHLGSPHYIAPEQAQGQMATSSSDIYALGILLYEMCTGVVPFRGENTYAVIAQQINALPAPPMLINQNIPSALSNVILRALAKDNGTRFPNALVFSDTIAAACSLAPTFRIQQSSQPLPAYPPPGEQAQPLSILGVSQPMPPATPVFSNHISQPLPVPRQAQAAPQVANEEPSYASENTAEKTTQSEHNQISERQVPNPPSAGGQFMMPRTTMRSLDEIVAPQTHTPSQPLSQTTHTPSQPLPPTQTALPLQQQSPQLFAASTSAPDMQGPALPPQHNAAPYQAPSMPPQQQYQAPANGGFPMGPGSNLPQPGQNFQTSPAGTLPSSSGSKPALRSNTTMYTVLISIIAVVIILASVLGITLYTNHNTSTTNTNDGQGGITSNAPGTIFFQDDALGTNDQLRIVMNNVSAPVSDEDYYAWLQNDQQTVLMGPLQVQNQQVSFLYPGNAQHTNLLANIRGVLITNEKAGSSPQTPGQQVAYRAQFTPSILNNLRTLLYSTPEIGGRNAVATEMFETIKSMNDKAASIVDSLQNTHDTGLATRQATRIIEMVDGTNYARTSGHLPATIPSQINISIGLLSSPSQKGYIDIFDAHLNDLKAQAGNNTALLTRIQNTKNALDDLRDWIQKIETYDTQLLANAPDKLMTPDMLTIALQLKQEVADSYTGRIVPPDTGPTTKLGSAGAQQAYIESQYMAALDLNTVK